MPLRLGKPDDSMPATLGIEVEEDGGTTTLGAGIPFLGVASLRPRPKADDDRSDVEFSLPSPTVLVDEEETCGRTTFRGAARRLFRCGAAVEEMPTGATSREGRRGDAVFDETLASIEVDATGIFFAFATFGFGISACLAGHAAFSLPFSFSCWTASGRSDEDAVRPFAGVPLAVPKPLALRTLGVDVLLIFSFFFLGSEPVSEKLSSSGVASDSASAKALAMVSGFSW